MMRNVINRIVFTLALALAISPSFSHAEKKQQEANVVLHSTITGNQEQPKVLYIVPWQPPGNADNLKQPMQPLLNDVFAPVDRTEFQRELKYREEGQAAKP
ncbi:MAG TPA: hypothetical protein VGK97_09205 [Spongiibacteraceae bacterium]|jgi:hypothetical protein